MGEGATEWAGVADGDGDHTKGHRRDEKQPFWSASAETGQPERRDHGSSDNDDNG